MQKDNAPAVYKALKEFGASLVGLSVADFTEEGHYYQMGRPPMRGEIRVGIPGMKR